MPTQAHSRPIYVTRWTNFRALLASRKLTITAAASLLGKAQAQVSQFGGKVPTKPIGDQIAAEIEDVFNLPSGTLDSPQLDDLHAALHRACELVERMRSSQVSANSSFKPKPLRGSA